jgi:hypothetical protein
MNRYGQDITWGTLNAPHAFSGTRTSYSYRDNIQRQLDEDESGDNRVLIQHSRKASLSFEARVTDASTDFLDLSSGGAITISEISSGTILATRAVERWALGRPKTASIQATHYPDRVLSPAANEADYDKKTKEGWEILQDLANSKFFKHPTVGKFPRLADLASAPEFFLTDVWMEDNVKIELGIEGPKPPDFKYRAILKATEITSPAAPAAPAPK